MMDKFDLTNEEEEGMKKDDGKQDAEQSAGNEAAAVPAADEAQPQKGQRIEGMEAADSTETVGEVTDGKEAEKGEEPSLKNAEKVAGESAKKSDENVGKEMPIKEEKPRDDGVEVEEGEEEEQREILKRLYNKFGASAK
jgi:hypothetical protein